VRHIPELKGICVGGCVDKDLIITPDIATAHAHTTFFNGWICLKHKYLLKEKLVLLHEVAHLITDLGAPSHGKEWRKNVVALGGTYKTFIFHKTHITKNYTQS
jgi:hypothetical protein